MEIIDGQTQAAIASFYPGFGSLKKILTKDLDNDSIPEILVSSSESANSLKAFEVDGTFLWEITEPNYGTYFFAIGDVDQDQEEEIVAGGRDQMYILDLQTRTLEYESPDYNILKYHLSDFDEDGTQDLVIYTREGVPDLLGQLHFYDPTTHQLDSSVIVPDSLTAIRELRSGHTQTANAEELIIISGSRLVIYEPLSQSFSFIETPSGSQTFRGLDLADVNDDGIEEIWITYGNRDLRIFQYDGTTYSVIFDENLGGVVAGNSISVGNFDQDPDLEFACILNSRISVFNYPDLTPVWPSSAFSVGSLEELQTGDFDKDGILEIVVQNSVNVYKYHGETGQLLNQYDHPYYGGISVDHVGIGNYLGSSLLEVIGSFSGEPFILDKDFNRIMSFPLPERKMSHFTIADIDNDGRKDLFLLGLRGVHHYEQISATAIDNPPSEIPQLSVYPNPTSSVVKIEIPEPLGQGVSEIHVYTSLGSRILSQNVRSSRETLDLSRLPTGLYVIALYSGEQLMGMSKLLKQ